jgi:hypothetical protein
MPRVDRVLGQMRRLPPQRDRRRVLLLRLDQLQPQRIPASAEQPDRRPIFLVVARLHARVDQGPLPLFLIHPQLAAVFGLDDELVVAGVGREHAPPPSRRKLFFLDLLRLGTRVLEIEVDGCIEPLELPIAPPRPLRFVILPLQAALGRRFAARTKRADQISERIAILPHGQPRQLDPRRVQPGLRVLRIERIVHVLRHALRIRPHAIARRILRHRLADKLRQLENRAIAGQCVRILVGPLAVVAVTRSTVLLVDFLAGALGWLVVGRGDSKRKS